MIKLQSELVNDPYSVRAQILDEVKFNIGYSDTNEVSYSSLNENLDSNFLFEDVEEEFMYNFDLETDLYNIIEYEQL